MIETFDIAGYARISVDDEQDQKNISIENQKAIIEDYVKTRFPSSTLTFFEDRDRSGYTFDQREGYQEMRRGLMRHKYDILIIKDFSRFSRRNSRGLVELEDLRDAGVRIISIGDGIDFPNDDDWLKIQFQFLVNEMPVTDTSRKVRSVVKRRQNDGEWICAAPYGYLVTEDKHFEIIPTEAETVRRIFDLYSNAGWGYKNIANYLTDQGVPTPRMSERMRKEAAGKKTKREAKMPGPSPRCRAFWTTIFISARSGRASIPAPRSTARRSSATTMSISSLKTTIRPSSTTAPSPSPSLCGKSAAVITIAASRSMTTCIPAFCSVATAAVRCLP